MDSLPYVARCAAKGALIGAPLLALTGFVSGIVLMAWFQMPVPPLITFEAGLVVGTVLGGLVGLIVGYRISRCVLYTLVLIGGALALSSLLGARLDLGLLERLALVGTSWVRTGGWSPASGHRERNPSITRPHRGRGVWSCSSSSTIWAVSLTHRT